MSSIMITIPTEAELSDRLAGIERLMTAKGWERAAIVWAFTTDDDSGGRPRKGETASEVGQFPMPIREFARLGFHGLRSQNTVAAYRKAWDDAVTEMIADPTAPGQEVTLPDPATHPYPGSGRESGKRSDLYGTAHKYGVTNSAELDRRLKIAEQAERATEETAQRVESARQTWEDHGMRHGSPERDEVNEGGWMSAVANLQRAAVEVRAATRGLADVVIDGEVREILTVHIAPLTLALSNLNHVVAGEMDAELAEMSNDGGRTA